jgi:hypothetical protein
MGQKNGSLGTPRGSEISSRRVERGRWSEVETDVFGVLWGASRLVGWAGCISRLLFWIRAAQPSGVSVWAGSAVQRPGH